MTPAGERGRGGFPARPRKASAGSGNQQPNLTEQISKKRQHPLGADVF
ncbi:hypothetical protein [Neobacillus cucumis]|nr:hypothetical protein [Neobacillus cucumis]